MLADVSRVPQSFSTRAHRTYSPGSTTVHFYEDPSLPVEELGASIFVKANKNLFKAAEAFNLTLTDLDKTDEGFAIWDGSRILLTVRPLDILEVAVLSEHPQQLTGGWMDIPKVLWRYGFSAPSKASAL